jgi:hypothetical protein
MARPGAPSKVTPELAAEIDAMHARRLPLRAMARALAAQGHPVGASTVRRYLARRDGDCSFLAAQVPSAAPAPMAQAAATALETDDLAALTLSCAEVEIAMRAYADDIGRNPTSTRAYAALARLQADLRARLVQLRPAPEVEQDRFTELGHAAMTELLEIARSRAEQDWQGRYRRARETSGT